MLVVCALLAPLGARAFDAPTIHVSDDAEFAAAVSALSEQGGTIVLRPHFYRGELVVSARSTRPLRIVGQPGARVERMLLDNTQRVSLSGITIEPATADAWIELARSHDIELDDVHVRADETTSPPLSTYRTRAS